ncbi:MAG: CAP domain-containing protein [Lacisediminihabitans sp.]
MHRPTEAGSRHRRARALFGILVAVFVALGVVAPLAAPSASAAPADTIYSLVNQARAAAGLPGFLHNPGIDAVAVSWANQMGAAGVMSHNPQYSTQIPGGWTRAGENVAEGYPTAQAMFDAWMHSPGHRANILGDFTDIGIAFVSVNGKSWGVQDFGKYPGHVGPPAPAPAPVPAPAPAPAPVPAPAPAPAPAPPPAAPVPVVQAPVPTAAPAPSPAAADRSLQGKSTTPDAAVAAPGTDKRLASGLADNSASDGAVVAVLVSTAAFIAAVGVAVLLWTRRRRA